MYFSEHYVSPKLSFFSCIRFCHYDNLLCLYERLTGRLFITWLLVMHFETPIVQAIIRQIWMRVSKGWGWMNITRYSCYYLRLTNTQKLSLVEILITNVGLVRHFCPKTIYWIWIWDSNLYTQEWKQASYYFATQSC